MSEFNIEKDIDFKFKPREAYTMKLLEPDHYDELKRKADLLDLIVAEAEKIWSDVDKNGYQKENMIGLIADIADYPNVDRWNKK